MIEALLLFGANAIEQSPEILSSPEVLTVSHVQKWLSGSVWALIALNLVALALFLASLLQPQIDALKKAWQQNRSARKAHQLEVEKIKAEAAAKAAELAKIAPAVTPDPGPVPMPDPVPAPDPAATAASASKGPSAPSIPEAPSASAEASAMGDSVEAESLPLPPPPPPEEGEMIMAPAASNPLSEEVLSSSAPFEEAVNSPQAESAGPAKQPPSPAAFSMDDKTEILFKEDLEKALQGTADREAAAPAAARATMTTDSAAASAPEPESDLASEPAQAFEKNLAELLESPSLGDQTEEIPIFDPKIIEDTLREATNSGKEDSASLPKEKKNT